MTGFGRGTSQVERARATVEVRSVNTRFLEVSLTIPDGLAVLEPRIEQLVKSSFERGRFKVHVSLEQEAGEDLPMHFDAEVAAGYARLLDRLREAAGVSDPVDLEHLLHFSEAFLEPGIPTQDDERAWKVVEGALSQAIERLQKMRREEGRSLEADLQRNVDAMRGLLEAVEARLPDRLDEAKTRLHERITELLDQHDLEPERLAQEVAYLTDRLDISEECVRLHSHMQLFDDALDSDEAVGRRLNFIIQEMHREVNTIGSKANDAEIARHAVSMKEIIEKLREQVQNVE